MGNNASQKSDIVDAPVVVYSKTTCPYCVRAKNFLQNEHINYMAFELNKMDNGAKIAQQLRDRTGSIYVPQIFICGNYIGGYDDLVKLQQDGRLHRMAEKCMKPTGVEAR